MGIFSSATDYIGRNTGSTLLATYGGGGMALGAAYGAFSDTETVMSGAFKGGILGGGGITAAKYGVARMHAGQNKILDDVFSNSKMKDFVEKTEGLLSARKATNREGIENINATAIGKFIAKRAHKAGKLESLGADLSRDILGARSVTRGFSEGGGHFQGFDWFGSKTSSSFSDLSLAQRKAFDFAEGYTATGRDLSKSFKISKWDDKS